MSWVKKLVSLLFGDEEEKDTNDDQHEFLQEQQAVKNVLSDSPPEREIRYQTKVDTRVSYQYPKGNFRFPIIPDERNGKRDDRPRRRMEKQEDNPKKFRENKSHASKNYDPYTKVPVEEKKEMTLANKRPFHPTAIPSPVFGFQSRDARMQNEPYHLRSNGQDQKPVSDMSKSEEEKIPSAQPKEKYEINHEAEPVFRKEQVHREEQQNPIHSKDSFVSVEEVDKFLAIENDKKKMNVENQHEEEDLLDEALTIVKTEYQKQNHEDQAEIIQASVIEEQIEHLDEEDEAVVLELEPIQEGDELIEVIQDQKTLIDDQPSSSDPYPTADEQETESVEEQTHEGTNPIQNTPRRKTVPFNVMMLGRDKQKLRENRQEHSQEHSYHFPSLNYLNIPEKELTEDHDWLESQKDLLNVTLKNFNVGANVVNVTQGPSVTRFEVHPEPGVKVNKITNLSDDIKLSLSAKDIRIEAPIPGKNTIGIEVPNKVSKMVYLREILKSTEFRSNPSPMTAVLGLDIAGQPAVTDLKKMPHGLIAGATGSGKSVCINTILISLLYKASPHEVKLMLIDPKMVELAPYNEIPHLVSPVITDVKAATAALKWAVEEMERRYELFAHSGTREITRYNQLVKEHKQGEHLPYLVIIIDELADLMMVAPNDVEEAICRIAQKARACGIHLIVATQRPSVDVITGLIKANIPTRIAFSVSSQVDSRTIIDVNGAEKLLGKGDMLFLENGSSKAVRLQGTFVSDEEIERVVKHVKLQSKPEYLFHQDELVKKATIQSEEDELFLEACEFVVNQGGASTSSLQRRFRIGYNRAARLIDMMEEQGIISENRGSKPRDVLISEEELDAIQETHVL